MKNLSLIIGVLAALSSFVCFSAEAQRFLQPGNDGVACWSNTAKDGSGTDYQPLLDTDGHLQVDVLSGGGGGVQYTEDDAAPANPVGTAMMMERDDVLGGLTSVAGDWTHPFSSAEGALWTQDFNSDAILADTASMDTNLGTVAGAVSGGQMQVDIVADGAGLCLDASVDGLETLVGTTNSTLSTIDADTGSILTSVQTIDNAIHVDDAAFTLGSDSGVMMMGFAGTQSVNANDAAAIALDTDGAVHISDGGNVISVDDAAGSFTVDGTVTCDAGTGPFPVSDNASSLTVDGTVAVSSITTFPDNEPFNIAQMNGVAVTMGNGNSGTGVQRVTIAADSTGKVEVVGDVADDAVAAGNPVQIAGKAVETDGTDPGSVSAENDAAGIKTDRNRRLLVNTMHPNSWCASENNATAQTNNAIHAAPGAGLSLYITDVIISCGATAGSVKIVEDTAGTPVTKIDETYCAITGGAVIPLRTPIRITANKDVGYTSTTVTTHTVTVCGYIAP